VVAVAGLGHFGKIYVYVCTPLVVRVFLLRGNVELGVGSTFLGLCSDLAMAGVAVKRAKMQLLRIAGGMQYRWWSGWGCGGEGSRWFLY
jgi:hypothetical protein